MNFMTAARTLEVLKDAWLKYEPKLPLHLDSAAFIQELQAFLTESSISEEEKRFYLALTIMHNQMLAVTAAEKAWVKARNTRPAKVDAAAFLNQCPSCGCDLDAAPPIMSEAGFRHCTVCFSVLDSRR